MLYLKTPIVAAESRGRDENFCSYLPTDSFFLFIKRIAQKRVFKGRQPLSLEEIFDSLDQKHQIEFETFVKVYKALGEFYHVDPSIIRPEDALKIFFDIDSWDLDTGTEKMEKWLRDTFNIAWGKKQLLTVLDLLIFIEGD